MLSNFGLNIWLRNHKLAIPKVRLLSEAENRDKTDGRDIVDNWQMSINVSLVKVASLIERISHEARLKNERPPSNGACTSSIHYMPNPCESKRRVDKQLGCCKFYIDTHLPLEDYEDCFMKKEKQKNIPRTRR
jgi:hypothetical protein